MPATQIIYSEKYYDDTFEYRYGRDRVLHYVGSAV